MKRFLAPVLIALTFSVMFSSTSFAGWTKVSEDTLGTTFYVDFERIRKHDGFVYYWVLIDFLKPDKWGNLSGKTYKQGDCNLFRVKFLSNVHHKQQMGRDIGESSSSKNPEWTYLPPNTFWENILKSVCGR